MHPYDSQAHQEAHASEHGYAVQGGRDVFFHTGPSYAWVQQDQRTPQEWSAELRPGLARQYAALAAYPGEGHPQTMAALEQLGQAEGWSGDALAACRSHERLLAVRKQVLGPAHPDTLRSADLLAGWLGRLQQPVPARDVFAVLAEELDRVPADRLAVAFVHQRLAAWRSEVARQRGYSSRDKRHLSRKAQEEWRRGIS